MNQYNIKSEKPLKDSLLERIETEQVCPRPKLFFKGKECAVWSLWLLSVVVGAFAVAVSFFVVTHRQYELYEATHENFFTFMVDVLPYAWFFVFALMVYVAIYNMRHTKRGYRYPVSFILLSSFVLSMAGGLTLQAYGIGYTVDNMLGRYMAMYLSQEKLEEKLWQVPTDGRLIGRQVLNTVSPSSIIVFEDMSGNRWRTDVGELMKKDVDLLASGQTVRLLGKSMNVDLFIFHACGAFPWMIDKEVTIQDLNAERQAFIERVYIHAKKAENHLRLLENRTFASTSLPVESVCANIAAVRRMPVSAP